MTDQEIRCKLYNRAKGTNLTVAEYERVMIDELKKSEKIESPSGRTIGLERNINRKIMRKMRCRG